MVGKYTISPFFSYVGYY